MPARSDDHRKRRIFIGVVVARKRNFGIEVVGSGTVYVTDSVWKPFIRGVGLEASDIFIRMLFFDRMVHSGGAAHVLIMKL